MKSRLRQTSTLIVERVATAFLSSLRDLNDVDFKSLCGDDEAVDLIALFISGVYSLATGIWNFR